MTKLKLKLLLGAVFLGSVTFTVLPVIEFWNAETIILDIEGYDPRDLLRGHFLRYRVKGELREEYPGLEKLYISDKQAETIDAMVRDTNNKSQIKVKVTKSGKARAIGLIINGKEIL